jgi:hypothetical protein
MAAYFGYLPELIERFLQLFAPAECLEWLEANEAQVSYYFYLPHIPANSNISLTTVDCIIIAPINNSCEYIKDTSS